MSSKFLLSLTSSLLLLANSAQATFITGPADPNYGTTVQGASAATFGGLGYTVGTGLGELHVSLGTWSDPSGLVFATLAANANVIGTGTTVNKLSDAYTQPGPANSGDHRDYIWIQNLQNNGTNNQAADQPWKGNVFDMGGQANKAVVFPIIDHRPWPIAI